MSEKELRNYLAEHVMGWDLESEPFRFFKSHDGLIFWKAGECGEFFNPTTDPAAAMQVLKACLKSSRPHGGIVIYDSQISQVPCFTVEAQAIGNLRVQA